MSWCRRVGAIVLLTFGTSLFVLLLHLVHHLHDPAPQCQILAFSVTLDASMPSMDWTPSVTSHWQELHVLYHPPTLVTPPIAIWARAPPSCLASAPDVSTT